MGSITLTNIPQFIEQPGRNIVKTAGSLDRMTVPFLGPYNVPIPFSEGSPDSVYPLMFCTGYTEKANGALSELTVNYAGRTDATGSASTFVSEFLISHSASEKELSYSRLSSGLISYGPPTGGANSSQTNWYKTCTLNYVLHYITTTVSYKYCCYPFPLPLGLEAGSQPTITSEYTRFTGAGSATLTPGPPVDVAIQYPGPFGFIGPITRQSAFSSQQAIGGWHECTVTYDARYEVP